MKRLKNIKKEDKIFCLIFGIILSLVILLNIFDVTKFTFLLLSALANLVLIFIYKKCIRLFKVKFDKKQKLFILFLILLIYIFYFYSILTRNFIYYWDYSCYYNLQLITESNFDISLLQGIKGVIGSTWSGEYGTFLSFFIEIIFNFTNRNINSYLLSSVIIFIPYIIISLSILIKVIINKLKIKKENLFLNLSLIIFSIMPILHATFIYGQPDLFGLSFIFLMVALTINYEFEKLEIERLILLFIITYMLLITRRWYMYFILSYYVCYVIKILVTNLKDRKKIIKIIKNGLLLALIAGLLFIVTLFPLVKNIVASDFSYSYSFYLTGGFKTELVSQINHLGYILFFIILTGLIYGIAKKEYRLISILGLFCYFLIIFLFTRIQNMGLHHTLILLPIYLYYFYLFLTFILKKFDNKKYILSFCLVSILIINFMNGYNGDDNKLFTDISLKTPIQKDYNEIKAVSYWLKNNLNKKNKAYMITHNNTYNPDKFRNFYMPDLTIYNNLPYGSAVLGVHKFPLELFEAKYVITTTPFESISIEEKYNIIFNKLIDNEIFVLKKDFNMQNGYNILIYERVKRVDKYEISLYLNNLEEESKLYPGLYNEIIQEYAKERNIDL